MPGPGSAAVSSRERIALVLLSVAAVAIVLAAAPYKTFDLDRYFVPKELVLNTSALIAAWLCISRCQCATLSLVDVLLAAFLVTGVVSAIFAPNLWVAERALAISFSGV